jgi:hypothetical protein
MTTPTPKPLALELAQLAACLDAWAIKARSEALWEEEANHEHFARIVRKAAAALSPSERQEARHLTVTTTPAGECVLVSWQDEEHRILEVVWERQEAAAAGQGEREAFEAWWLDENLGDEESTAELRWLLRQDDDGDYLDDDTSYAWRAWQARASLPACGCRLGECESKTGSVCRMAEEVKRGES